MKIPTCEEKITKVKLQMNEHEISFHVRKYSRLQIVQPEFTTWKYKVKLSADQPTEVFYKKHVLKIFAICTESTCVGVYF